MTGRIVIIESSLVRSGGHHSVACAQFARLLGPEHVVIVAGSLWRGSSNLGGSQVYGMLKINRDKAARLRRYGRMVTYALSIAEHTGTAGVLRQFRNADDKAPVFSVATRDAASVQSILTADIWQSLKALRVGASDKVFMPSADAETLLAVSKLLEQALTRGSGLPKFYLRLMYDNSGAHSTDLTWQSALTVLRARSAATEQVSMLAETDRFAEAIEQIWEVPVTRLPHPSALTPTAAPVFTPNSGNNVFRMLVPGNLRADKGRHKLISVARALANRLAGSGHSMQLCVQGEISQSFGGVSITGVPAHLSDTGYSDLWRNAHAALMLHDEDVYRMRGSGVVCDAVAAMRPFICLEHTSLAQWTHYDSAVCSEAGPQSIADAIWKFMTNYNSYTKNAETALHAYSRILHQGIATLQPNIPIRD